MSRQIIAIDVDDVLTDTSQSIVEYSNTHWGTNLTIEDYSENWHPMWGVDAVEGKRREEETLQMMVQSEPFKGVAHVLEKLSKSYTLVVTTSRSNSIANKTKQWLDQHYTNIFTDAHFAGIWDGDNSRGHTKLNLTKASLLKEVGASYLIDDHPKHCFAAAELEIPAVLFGEYPWNRDVELPEGVTRCLDWQAVEEYFDARG